jgi:hypothetical protein
MPERKAGFNQLHLGSSHHRVGPVVAPQFAVNVFQVLLDRAGGDNQFGYRGPLGQLGDGQLQDLVIPVRHRLDQAAPRSKMQAHYAGTNQPLPGAYRELNPFRCNWFAR